MLILGFDAQAWLKHKDNLIVIERYHFFASSCKQFDHRFQSLSQLKSDESEPDGILASVLKVLKQTHSLYFEVCSLYIEDFSFSLAGFLIITVFSGWWRRHSWQRRQVITEASA